MIKLREIDKAPKSTLDEITELEISENSTRENINVIKRKVKAIKKTKIDDEVFKTGYEHFTQSIERAPIDLQRDLFATFFQKKLIY